MNRQTWTMIILAFALGASGCGDSGPDPPLGTVSNTTDAALLDADGKVGCLAVTAYAADNTEDTAAEVTPCGASATGKDFKKGSVVTTDAVGEAFIDIPPSCRIHVFRNSTLEKSACPKGGTGGNACVSNGTVAFNGCSANVLIGTPSAKIVLDGTWVTVSYVPDLELTQVDVLQGLASVTPVTDIDSGSLDATVSLTAGQSLYTATDDFIQATQVLDLEGDAREPVATLDLYLQGFASNLSYVAYVPALSLAADDGVLSGDLVGVAEEAPWILRVSPTLQEADEPVQPSDIDIALLEAIEVGVDWAKVFDASGISVFTASVDSLREASPLAADGTIDMVSPNALVFTQLQATQFDPGFARGRIDEMVDDPDVVIVVPSRSRGALIAAEQVADYFRRVGLDPTIQADFASDVEALDAYNRLSARGVRVISLTQR